MVSVAALYARPRLPVPVPVLEEYPLFGVAPTVAEAPVGVVELAVVEVDDGTVMVEDCTNELGAEEDGADENATEEDGAEDEDGEDDGKDDNADEDVTAAEDAALDLGAW